MTSHSCGLACMFCIQNCPRSRAVVKHSFVIRGHVELVMNDFEHSPVWLSISMLKSTFHFLWVKSSALKLDILSKILYLKGLPENSLRSSETKLKS